MTQWKFGTRTIHEANQPDAATGALQPPVYLNTAYDMGTGDRAAALFGLDEMGFSYSRLTNPTVARLEERLAALEGGVGATCAASGHAAEFLCFFNLMQPGDEIVASNKLYGGSYTQLSHSYQQFGWKTHMVDADDPENIKRAMTDKTKAVFVEGLANPKGAVIDLEACAKIAHAHGVPLVVDNTLATPYLCRPIEWGADIVVHSTTKFLNGNGTAMGGVVIDAGTFDWAAAGKFPLLTTPDPSYQGLNFVEKFGKLGFTVRAHASGLRDMGPCQSPMNAYLTLMGLETLHVRMQRHVENARKVAEFLQQHPLVSWVSYASLPSSPYYAHAQKYVPEGAGALFAFGVKAGEGAAKQLAEQCRIFKLVANLGDVRSLLVHPWSTTHRQMSEEAKVKAGIPPEMMRIAIGLEDADDLCADLDAALRAVS